MMAFVLEHPQECPNSRMFFDQIFDAYPNMHQYLICQFLYGDPIERLADDCEMELSEAEKVIKDFTELMRVSLSQTANELIGNEKFGEFCGLN